MAQIHPWVILFDIDGTLITVDRNFNRPLLRSIIDDLNINYSSVETDPFSGRTDHDILTSFLEHHDYNPSLYRTLKCEYLNRLKSQIKPRHITRHPFVDEAIEYFESEGCILGLLTGNFPAAAEVKLSIAGITLEYEIGAFGEHHRDRNELPRLALNKAETLFGAKADPTRFLIIGDTPRDVVCAKSAGMRCVAVTTGKFSREELAVHHPDLIVDSLKWPQEWFPKLVGREVANPTSIQ